MTYYEYKYQFIDNGGRFMSNNGKPQQNEFLKAMSFFFQIGVTILACLAVGIFLGWFLDNLLGTTPWLLMVFSFLGVVAAFRSIFDFAKKIK